MAVQPVAFGANLGPGRAYTVRLPKPPSAPKLGTHSTPSIHIPALKFTATPASSKNVAFGDHNIKSSDANVFSAFSIHKPSGPTADQILHKLYEQKQPSHSSGGVLGLIEHGGGDILGGALNLLSRTNQASAGFAKGAVQVLQGQNADPVMMGLAGLEDKTHYHYSDVIAQAFPHFAKEHSTATQVLGFGGDVAFDPLSYVGGAGVFGHSIEEGGVAGFKLFKGLHPLENGSATFEGKIAKELADHNQLMVNKGLVAKIDAGEAVHTTEHMMDVAKQATLERGALAEAQANSEKYIGIRLGPTRAHSITLKTPFKVPKLLGGGTDAARNAWVEGRSPIGKLAGAVAQTFKPGYLDRTTHALQNTARHSAELFSNTTFKRALGQMAKHHGMDITEMQKALVAAEKPGTVDTVTHAINSDVLRNELEKQGLSGAKLNEAEAFVQDWHNVMEHLRHSDRLAGILYKKTGHLDRVYIPHINQPGKARHIVTTSATSKAAHEMYGKKLSYAQRIAGINGPSGEHIIQDPMELLSRRVMKGATAQSHAITREVVRRAFGTPERVFNMARRDKAYARVRALKTEHGVNRLLMDTKGGRDFYARMMAAKARKAHLAPTAAKLAAATVRHETRSAALASAKGRARGAATKAARAAESDFNAALRAHEAAAEKAQNVYKDALAKHGIEYGKQMAKAEARNAQIEKQLPAELKRAWGKMWERNPAAEGKSRIDTLAYPVIHNGKVIRTIHYRVPPELKDHVQNLETALNDPARMSGLEQGFRKFMANWKVLATAANPGYRVRNTLSDGWNMYIAGVPMHAMIRYSRIASQVMLHYIQAERKIAELGDKAVLSKAERKSLNILRTGTHHGAFSGLFAGDVGKRVEELRGKGLHGSKFAPQHLYGTYTRAATHFNAHAENWGRLVHYLYRTESEHMTAAAAAEQVRIAHFDYEDLTATEQRVFKQIAPFYTWTRKNVPYQIMSMVRSPGRVATYAKLANTTSNISGAKPTDVIGGALDFHPLAIRDPFGKGYIDAQVGLNDLFNVEHPSKLVGNLLGPQFQLPIEAATGKNLSGQAISGPDASHQAVPAPGWLSNALSAVGMGEPTQRLVHGKEMRGPGINPWLAQILQQVPIGSYALSRNPISRAQKGQTWGGIDPRTLSYFGGLNYTTPDPANEQVIQSIKDATGFKSYVKHLRDQGIIPNSTYKPGHSAFDNWLKKKLAHQTTSGVR